MASKFGGVHPLQCLRAFTMAVNVGDVYPLPDLAAVPTSTAPMLTLPVDIQCTLGLLSLEMLSEYSIDNLGDGQAVQVCLTLDDLDPAAFDAAASSAALETGVARA